MKKFTALSILFTLFISVPVFADKIAIIGGGAAGTVSAWLLEKNHDVTLFEAQDHLGGHINTVEIEVGGKKVLMEAGTEFFNEEMYPHFLKLLRYFNLPLKKFTSVTNFYRTDKDEIIILPPYHDGIIEWKSLTPENLVRAIQLKSVLDNAKNIFSSHNTSITLKQYLDTQLVCEHFKNDFLYPLLSSQWGVSPKDVQDFSAFNALRYMAVGNETGSAEWIEASNGLRNYLETVALDLQNTKN